MATPTFEEIMAGASAAVGASATVREIKNRPVAQKLDDDDSLPPKVLAIGDYATGKTELLLGPLLLGERVWVVETDNGSGLSTIKAMLDPRYGNPRCLNRPELLANVYHVVIPTYPHFMEFLREPLLYFPDLEAFDPTVCVWEGLSNFQANYIDMEILKDENADPTEARLDSEDKFEYYRKLKRATIRAVDRFLVMPGPKGPLPKIITVLKNTETKQAFTSGNKSKTVVRVDSLTGEERTAALIQGAAEALLMPAFDVIVTTEKATPRNPDPLDTTILPATYRYNFSCKNRYGNLGDSMPADSVELWRKIRQGGVA